MASIRECISNDDIEGLHQLWIDSQERVFAEVGEEVAGEVYEWLAHRLREVKAVAMLCKLVERHPETTIMAEDKHQLSQEVISKAYSMADSLVWEVKQGRLAPGDVVQWGLDYLLGIIRVTITPRNYVHISRMPQLNSVELIGQHIFSWGECLSQTPTYLSMLQWLLSEHSLAAHFQPQTAALFNNLGFTGDLIHNILHRERAHAVPSLLVLLSLKP